MKRIVAALCIIAFFAGIFILHRFDPSESSLYPDCIFYSLTGLYCPGCGTGRALHNLLNGKIFTALRYNPGLFVIILLIAVHSLQQLKKPKSAEYIVYTEKLIIIILTGYFILRNIPVYPFTLLRPFGG